MEKSRWERGTNRENFKRKREKGLTGTEERHIDKTGVKCFIRILKICVNSSQINGNLSTCRAT